jgi:trimeric autotransporter adhesin
MFARRSVLPSRPLFRRAAILAGRSAGLAALVTCTDPEAPTAESDRPAAGPVTSAAVGATGVGTIPLPIFQGVTTTATVFGIVQNGTGPDGLFLINNANNSSSALRGITNGLGRAGDFQASNVRSRSPALFAISKGLGPAATLELENAGTSDPALQVRSNGRGGAATIIAGNPQAQFAALFATTRGVGKAGEFFISNSQNTSSALTASTIGPGTGLSVHLIGSACTSSPSGCNLAVFASSGVNQIRFGRLGRGYFNGGTQTGGADVAEAFAVEGRPADYEPGDVLVISTRSDRRMERSSAPYSTLVAGVYATKPGVLLTERHIDESLDDTVPLGVVGVIPTKVSAENGAIRRGDLLVTGRIPGHAMRADPARLRIGANLGKALEAFAGPGTGLIRVLVSVR